MNKFLIYLVDDIESFFVLFGKILLIVFAIIFLPLILIGHFYRFFTN